MTALELLVCVVLASVSAWLSASEISLFSLSRFQLRSLKERYRSAHRQIKRLLADPTGLLITILVVNEIVNVALSSVIAQSIARLPKPGFLLSLPLPAWGLNTLLGLVVATPIVLLLCEITPKVIASRANRVVAPLTARPLSALYDLLMPVRAVLKYVVERVAALAAPGGARHRKNGAKEDDEGPNPKLLRESDFMLMVEEGHKEGAVQQSERDLIRNVFELDDTMVADVFTPLSQVQTVAEKTTLLSALNMMRSQKYSRIPVTASGTGGRRKVVGILYSKDLLRARLEPELMRTTIDRLMRKPLFVSPSTRLNSLFRKFKQQKTHMSVVQGPAGEALGIVTMRDILSALFDDILREGDEG